jgi:hypothetical protein
LMCELLHTFGGFSFCRGVRSRSAMTLTNFLAPATKITEVFAYAREEVRGDPAPLCEIFLDA